MWCISDSRSRFAVAVAAAAAALAACTPTPGPRDAGTSTSSPAPPAAAPCATAYQGTSTPDCAATSGAHRATKVVRGRETIVTITDGRAPAQTITVPNDGSVGSGVLLLRNLTDGGDPDVLISTTGSGAHGRNSNWSLWHRISGTYRQVGSLYGGEFWNAGHGYLAQYGSGGGWSVQFARIVGGSLQPAAAVGRADTAGVRDPRVPDCSVSDTGADAGPADPCALAMRQAHDHGLTT